MLSYSDLITFVFVYKHLVGYARLGIIVAWSSGGLDWKVQAVGGVYGVDGSGMPRTYINHIKLVLSHFKVATEENYSYGESLQST